MYEDTNRLAAIETPLGQDVLLVGGFIGQESMSGLFSFDLELLSENHSIVFEDIIGQSATVSVYLPDESQRYFHGIISSFSQNTGDPATLETTFSSYSATLVPWVWLLQRTTDSRIYQNKTVPEIAETVFTEKGFTDYEFRLQETYDTREYTVQYRETDYAFVCRLFEEEGIHFFFEHEIDRHVLIVADSPTENASCPFQAEAKYQTVASDSWEETDTISGFEVTRQIRSGKYTLNDYNFTMPAADLKTSTDSKVTLGPGERERYDYPARYSKRSSGDRLVTVRMEEEEAQITTIKGSGRCRAFITGHRFTLTDYFRDDLNNKDYLLTRIEHTLTQAGSYLGDSSTEGDTSYTNTFECIPWDTPFRPLRTTPIPVIDGLQTAVVVGPAGEEIYTDQYGRVKVQFPWDREGGNNEESSCWIRVSQGWGGPSWGAMFIPRIGHEVIVDFEEGDPNRPMITGRVYHANNMPPYELPANKTMSTIKSNSSPGGGGSNEFRFEDKAGSEEIYLHGQKDWNTLIENNRTHTVGVDETISIGNNRAKSVGNDQSESIGNNKTIQVANNHTESIGVDMSETIGSSCTQSIGTSMTQTIGTDSTQSIGANSTQSIGSNSTQSIGNNSSQSIGVNSTISVGNSLTQDVGHCKTETISSKCSLSVGSTYTILVTGAQNTTVGGAIAEQVGGAKSILVGLISSEMVGLNKSVKAGVDIAESAGSNFDMKAGSNMTLTCGASSMTLPSGGDIAIKGSKVAIN